MADTERMELMGERLADVCRAFSLKGTLLSAEPFGNGHINGTFRIVTEENGLRHTYIVQRINDRVFRDPNGVMENIAAVTAHLWKKGITTIRFYQNPADETYVAKIGGEYWRVEDCLPGESFDAADDPAILRNSGQAFGRFINALSDIDVSALHETIPAFHDTASRFEALSEAKKADVSGRSASSREELRLFEERREKACLVAEAANAGKLPVRVTHNDTKFNNVIMDPLTKEAVAVIDLDTVMPGTLLFDYGDAIRFLSNTAAEDEADLSGVHFDIERFRLFSEGFLKEVRVTLTESERRLLPYAPFDATMECGARFLTDYLSGDTYFKTAYPEHNLIRARNQLALAMDMERHEEEIISVIGEILK